MPPADPDPPCPPDRAGPSPPPDPAGRPSSDAPADRDATDRRLEAHWRRTLRFTVALLAVWFVAGYVVAIVLAPWLNRFDFLGGPLGFWVAQNGAIYVFWLLILVYAVGMNRLDRELGVVELRARPELGAGSGDGPASSSATGGEG